MGRPTHLLTKYLHEFIQYSDDTARRLAEQLLSCTQKHNTSDLTLVAVVCAPSVFVQLKNLLTESDWKDGDSERKNFKPRVILLEHDARFEVFGDEFIWYDFKDPLKLPGTFVIPRPLMSHLFLNSQKSNFFETREEYILCFKYLLFQHNRNGN